MSQAAPNVPQPPPPPSRVFNSHTAVGKDNVIQLLNDECRWASTHPELQKGCFLSRVCQYAQPKECKYYTIASLLQVGPTCGLTALSMLLNGHPNAEELLLDAIMHNYTINGEMFSVQYLYELTQKHLSGVTCKFHEGVLYSSNVKEQLKAGCCLLVPYPFQP